MTLGLSPIAIPRVQMRHDSSRNGIEHCPEVVNGKTHIPSHPPMRQNHFGSYDTDVFYGFRDVSVDRNGTTVSGKVPLTRYDILHPQMGDFAVQSDYHMVLCLELLMVLRSFLHAFPWMYAVSDVGVKWGIHNLYHAPDLAVFSGIKQTPVHIEGTIDVVHWGWKPLLTLEVTSASTRKADMNKHNFDDCKYLQYEYIGIPYYVVIDQTKQPTGKAPAIYGYHLVRNKYRSIRPDHMGRIWIEPLGLALGSYQERIAWFTANGTRLLNLQEEQQRANQEAQARQAAEEELRQLKEKLGLLS